MNSLQKMVELVNAAGIDASKLALFDIYQTEGRILRDDVVSSRVREQVRAGISATHSTYLAVIESMPAHADLKKRVTA
jgi:hypothetical protein